MFSFAMNPLPFSLFEPIFFDDDSLPSFHKCGFSKSVQQTMLLFPGFGKTRFAQTGCLTPGHEKLHCLLCTLRKSRIYPKEVNPVASENIGEFRIRQRK